MVTLLNAVGAVSGALAQRQFTKGKTKMTIDEPPRGVLGGVHRVCPYCGSDGPYAAHGFLTYRWSGRAAYIREDGIAQILPVPGEEDDCCDEDGPYFTCGFKNGKGCGGVFGLCESAPGISKVLPPESLERLSAAQAGPEQ